MMYKKGLRKYYALKDKKNHGYFLKKGKCREGGGIWRRDCLLEMQSCKKREKWGFQKMGISYFADFFCTAHAIQNPSIITRIVSTEKKETKITCKLYVLVHIN